MKNNTPHYIGYLCAALSAICNATIGIFSVKAINAGLPATAIAFYRCLFAFILITSWLVLSGQFKQWLIYLKDSYLKIAICALFGFFILYTFETNAYNYASVPIVVFLLLGSSILTAFVLSAILHKHTLRVFEIISCLLAIFGLGLLLLILYFGPVYISSLRNTNFHVPYASNSAWGYLELV